MDFAKKNWFRLFLFTIGILSGCTTPERESAPEVGVWNYSMAIEEYGFPDSREALPDGGLIGRWSTLERDIANIEVYDSKSSMYKPAAPVVVKEGLVMKFDRNGILQYWYRESPVVHSDSTIAERDVSPPP